MGAVRRMFPELLALRRFLAAVQEFGCYDCMREGFPRGQHAQNCDIGCALDEIEPWVPMTAQRVAEMAGGPIGRMSNCTMVEDKHRLHPHVGGDPMKCDHCSHAEGHPIHDW